MDEDFEEGDEALCGTLNASMYGTRHAALNWHEHYIDHLEKLGFVQGRAIPCAFHNPARGIKLFVHGDDYVAGGRKTHLQWFGGQMSNANECKIQILGIDRGDSPHVKVLTRLISIQEERKQRMISYGVDPPHAEIIVKELGLETSKEVTTPMVKDEMDQDTFDATEELSPADATRYKSLVARANYLASDRLDTQHACREFSSSMSRPRRPDWDKLRRFVRYLKGKPRLVHRDDYIETCRMGSVYADANLAGDRKGRKSTSGGCILMGPHWVKAWSKTRHWIALSSAESEPYASVKASAEALGIQPIAKYVNMNVRMKILVNALAALGITSRRGIGQVRHLDTNHLWVQEMAAKKRLEYIKVEGTNNPADLMTKEIQRSGTIYTGNGRFLR